jgi:hypothetical protein
MATITSRVRRSLTASCLLVAAAAVGSAAPAGEDPRGIVPPPGVEVVKTLDQNWSDEESNWFYDSGQGSRLVPYDWFLALDQPGSEERFLATDHLHALGLIARTATPGNPDSLPVGFVRDAPYDDGTPALGITCAACHTALITHGKTAYLVDGGPSGSDVEQFLRRLATALVETADDDGRFDRFATRVDPAATPQERRGLRDAVREIARERIGYNDRNLSVPGGAPHGPGRIDAFGAIFNEVSATFLGIPGNARTADAPVSYPCLWDAPQHDRVQWNGIAENRTSALGTLIFGTPLVGALGRNTGEVLGVFGSARINDHELLLPRHYDSTANKAHLLEFEATLTTLWSPEWPTALGALDRAKIDRGAALYRTHCVDCHAPIDRADPDREVRAQMRAVGTDGKLLANTTRVVATGRLEGRQRSLQGLDRFDDQAPVAAILKHVVERVMLDPLPLPQLREALADVVRKRELIGPMFHSSVEVGYQGKSVRGDVSGIRADDDALTLYGAAADLDRLRTELGIKPDGGNSLRLAKGTVAGEYKARPLNGIWATAPYLHNGSVPTLVALLEPAARRPATFHVGSTEFDPQAVGFVDDPRFPVFDTSLPGNGNAGHEYASALSAAEKADLLEYLKSL